VPYQRHLIRAGWIAVASVVLGLTLVGHGAVSARAAEPSEPEEWKRSNPDVVVYLPKGGEAHDEDNEMLLVFEAPKSEELIAIWTQSSVEGFGDNRQMLSRSADGEHWSLPVRIVGSEPGKRAAQASWGVPVVSKAGRIYLFYVRDTGRGEERQASGGMGCMYSDDNGAGWQSGADLPMPRNRFDHADPKIPKNFWLWFTATRDRRGRWILGYTQVTSQTVRPKPSKNWCHADTRCAFVRFENLDEGPAPEAIQATWLPTDREGLEAPNKMYPQISTAQEPSLVLLPDGRLLVAMRTMTGHISYSVSDDDGASWRDPEPLRYRDGGPTVDQPLAPCPIFALADGRYLLLFHNNDGTLGEASQWKEKWKRNEANYIRRPAFVAVGRFQPNARQPVWFDPPKQILDTDGVIVGPKRTAEIATYPSLTEWQGRRTLWYPDRKHFLLGKHLPDALLDAVQP